MNRKLNYLWLIPFGFFGLFGIAEAFNFNFGHFGLMKGANRVYENLTTALSWSPSSKAFGNVSTGTVHTQLFTLTNSGNDLAEDITISTTGSAFRSYSGTCAAFGNLSAGKSCTKKVEYTSITGESTGFLNYSAPNIARTGAALSGTGVDYSPPTTPVISATAGDTQVTIALDSGGVGATSYNLGWDMSSHGAYGDYANSITGVTLPYVHTGRTNGTPYYYMLAAVGTYGTSYSTEATATPAAPNVNYCNDASAVACYYMNGANGAGETDRTTNGNNLSLTGTISSSSTVPSGYSGLSRSYSLGGSYLSINGEGGTLDINGATAKVSLSAWIRVATVPGSTVSNVILGKWDSTGNQRQYKIQITGTGSSEFKIEGQVSSGGSSAVTVSSTTTTYVANTWYHVCFVDNNVDLRLYVNGSLASTPSSHTAGIYNGNALFMIGNKPDGTQQFLGLIDEAGVFSRELTSTEVADIHTNGLTGNKGGSD